MAPPERGRPPSRLTRAARGKRGARVSFNAWLVQVIALALPDFLGFDSVISMSSKHPEAVAFALKLKQPKLPVKRNLPKAQTKDFRMVNND